MLAAIGDLVLDVAIRRSAPAELDDDCPAEIRLGGGGQAANFCAWAAALGERSRLITRVGQDELGQRLVADLETHGVEVAVVRGPDPTGIIAIHHGPNGERSMSTQRGASAGLAPGDLRAAWFAGVDLLHISAYALFEEPLAGAAVQAAQMARTNGALISIDLASAAGLRRYGAARMAGLLASLKPDLLFANDREASEMPRNLDDIADVVAIKLGPRGCRIRGEAVPAPAVSLVDTTGAGDAFAAAFCVAYLRGRDALGAARWAAEIAADSVTRIGGRP